METFKKRVSVSLFNSKIAIKTDFPLITIAKCGKVQYYRSVLNVIEIVEFKNRNGKNRWLKLRESISECYSIVPIYPVKAFRR